jgi:hypothetical protein
MKVSIAGFSFHRLKAAGVMDVFGYLESCRYRYGLDAADVWAGLIDHDLTRATDPALVAKVREGLDERGLVLANFHADGCHPWEDAADARAKHAALAERVLDAAEALGARTVRIDTGGRQLAWTDEQFDLIAATFRRWAKRAGDGGYRIGPEVHWGAETVPANLLKLAKAVDHPAFGILMHLGRYEGASADEGDRQLAPYAMHTHVDFKTATTRLPDVLASSMTRDTGATWAWNPSPAPTSTQRRTTWSRRCGAGSPSTGKRARHRR